MRKLAILVLLATVAVAIVAIVVAASSDQRSLAFTLGVRPGPVVASLERGDIACQGPIDVSARFSRVAFRPSAAGSAGVRVTVREADGGSVIASGSGRLGGDGPRVEVDEVAEGERIRVCLRSAGPDELELAGNVGEAARFSTLHLNGRPTEDALALVFERRETVSTLGLVPEMIDRASLFKGGLAPPWILWALLGTVLIAVPAALSASIAALRDQTGTGTSRYPPAG